MNVVRVFPRTETELDATQLDRLARLSTALLSDNLERDAGAPGLHLIQQPASLAAPMCGVALTVRTRPGDNLAIHHALDLVRPGDVLVIDGRGELTNALLGELMVAFAYERRAHGIVVDGAVRDVMELQASPVPVFARGWTHQGPYKSGPGSISEPVTVGGRVVRDGDVVLGDADGVVFVPPSRLDAVLEAAERKQRAEAAEMDSIRAGSWYRSFLADTLIEHVN